MLVSHWVAVERAVSAEGLGVGSSEDDNLEALNYVKQTKSQKCNRVLENPWKYLCHSMK